MGLVLSFGSNMAGWSACFYFRDVEAVVQVPFLGLIIPFHFSGLIISKLRHVLFRIVHIRAFGSCSSRRCPEHRKLGGRDQR